ncbi:MAG: 30S ribosomal protein S13 [Bacilli bacterium]
MALISGVDIPNEKRIIISLTYIFGIGKSKAKEIITKVNIDENKRTYELTENELNLIRSEISNYVIEGDLRRDVQMNVKRKMEINCYEGTRHKKKLPVRGQRTSRNARTCKNRRGKRVTVANKKKA